MPTRFGPGKDCLRLYRCFDGAEQEIHVHLSRERAHGSDPEDFSGELAETRGDLHFVVVDEFLAQAHFVYKLGRDDGRQVPNAVFRLSDQRFEAKIEETTDKAFTGPAVAVPATFQALFLDNRETLVHGVVKRRGGRVLVEVRRIKVFRHKPKVEIPGERIVLTFLEDFPGARTD